MDHNSTSPIETLSLDTFRSKIFDFEASQDWKFQGSRPAIIDFYADWCAPCRALAPILEDVAQTYKGRVDIYKINTEMTPELSAMFGIRGIPSLLFVPMQGEPAMATGLMAREGFDQAIADLFQLPPSQS